MSGAGTGEGTGTGTGTGEGTGAATHTPLDAAGRQTLFKSLTADNLQFAERNGFYKTDGSHMADPNVIFDSYRNADKLLGADRLPLPDLSNDEALDKWPGFEKLGVVKDAKDVKITPKKMPDGVDYDQAAEDRLRQRLVMGRVPAKFHQQIYDAEVEARLAEHTRQTQETAAEKTRIETDLRKIHGPDFDAVRTRAWDALNHIAKLAGVDAKALANESSVLMGGENMAKAWIQIGKMLGDDTIKGGGNDGFSRGPAAAKAELERLNGDAEHQKAMNDRTHSGHKAAVEREERLNKTIHGG